jgi:single-strand DNA-binding protein
MSGGLNRATIIGHLGGDPEIRRTQDGRPIGSLSIATSETWRDKTTGERKERTQWHRVVIFNEGLCKVAEQYLKKGAKVLVEGQMETRDWTDQANIKRYVTEIVLRPYNGMLLMLDRNGTGTGVPANDGAAEQSRDYGTSSSSSSQRRSVPSSGGGDMNDDIPF